MRRSSGVGPFAALVALAGVFACRQVAGITNDPPKDLTSIVCGMPYGTSECATCASMNCCEQSSACAARMMCSAYEGCLGKCNGDSACRSRCTPDDRVAVAVEPEVSSLSTCLAANCERECGLTAGSIADLVSTPDASASCASCLQATAPDQARACAKSIDCDKGIRCWLACQTPECRDKCAGPSLAEQYLEGQAFLDLGALIGDPDHPDPINGDCSMQCATGKDWRCVGHVSSTPPKKGSTATIHSSVRDYGNKQPIAEVDVKVCESSDVLCQRPHAQATTNPDGLVSLHFQNAMDTSTTMGLDGYLQITATGLRDTLYYWGFPLVGEPLGYWLRPADVTLATEFTDLATALNIRPADANSGTLAVVAYDCLGYEAPGVQVDLSNTTALTQPLDPLTGATSNVTGQGGLLVFANVPTGYIAVTGTPLSAIDQRSSIISANIRAGATTIVSLFPTPLP